ncbi:Hydrophobic surface binding protein A family protein [Venturia nashicola]|nr:Hydrophobic surface binding protein A family protein [Venturia nashicola]
MKLTLLPMACLLSSTIAAPVKTARKDTRAVDLAIQHVTAALTRLDAAFNNINSRSTNKKEQLNTANDILNINSFLQSELRTGTGVVESGGNVGPVEAVTLVTPVQKITTLTTQITDGWQGPVKKVFKAAGQRDAVLKELTTTKKASSDFADALTAKLPFAYQYIGTANKASATRSIQNAIDDYS